METDFFNKKGISQIKVKLVISLSQWTSLCVALCVKLQYFFMKIAKQALIFK